MAFHFCPDKFGEWFGASGIIGWTWCICPCEPGERKLKIDLSMTLYTVEIGDSCRLDYEMPHMPTR